MTPRWGFTPSVWIPDGTATTPTPPAPGRELRSVVLLARATAVMCVIAAAAETFRYVLLVRGRTEVLPVDLVRWSDALVVAAGWAAPLLGLATAVAFVPASGRAAAWAAHRARVRPTRSATRRLLWLLLPGWNLYGAGVVVAEVDAVLRTAPPPAPEPVRPDRMRWRSAQLPTVDLPQPAVTPQGAAAPVTPAQPPRPVHRSPSRLVSWWWAAWVLGGLLALATVIRALDPGSLQARANLVELHVVVDLVAAVTAGLTAAVAASWARLVDPVRVHYPTGWILPPAAARVGAGPLTGPERDLDARRKPAAAP
ncbi:DUF4328 domain-containing protein [Nakamurella deserti]|uniref:DUF4328 domain-containing protein n=1 Tax=Nakamurella deserti TaxID=2164074 RepID=UPI0013004099|nr:DUF4328 domain-containing protein [Nakamurella deserti]